MSELWRGEVTEDYGLLRNYINGEWVEARTSQYLDVENPATAQVIARVAGGRTGG